MQQKNVNAGNKHVGQAMPDNGPQGTCNLIQRQVSPDLQGLLILRYTPCRSGVNPTLKQGRMFLPKHCQAEPDLRRQQHRGFTLIELLVVVLIIGILAAVAVPQYKKAVWKSRNATLKTILKSIRQAEDAYFMANGTYAGNFDELTLDLPLEAPVQETNSSSYSTDNTCEIATMGSDSLRRGKDFEVVLNTTNLSSDVGIIAVWTDGPYKCAGFRLYPDSKLKCIGRYRDYAEGSRQEFCEKIEKGINKTSTPSWYYWDLP